jgi:hypothetical protein
VGVRLGQWFAVGSGSQAFLGADKHSNYHDFYQYYETRLSRFSPGAKLLEIGIYGGNSLAVWGAWFPAGIAVGVDLDTRLFQAHWPVLEVLGFRLLNTAIEVVLGKPKKLFKRLKASFL